MLWLSSSLSFFFYNFIFAAAAWLLCNELSSMGLATAWACVALIWGGALVIYRCKPNKRGFSKVQFGKTRSLEVL